VIDDIITGDYLNSFVDSEIVFTQGSNQIALVFIDDSVQDGVWLCSNNGFPARESYTIIKSIDMTVNNVTIYAGDILISNPESLKRALEAGVFECLID